MAYIYIKPVTAKRSVQDELDISKALNTIAQDVSRVRGNLRLRISASERIASRLRSISQEFEEEADKLDAMRGALEQIITTYEQAERDNLKKFGVGGWADIVKDLIWPTPFPFPGLLPTPTPGPFPFVPLPLPLPVLFPILLPSGVTPLPLPLLPLLLMSGSDFDPTIYSWKSEDGRIEHKASIIGGSKTDLVKALKDDSDIFKAIDDWEDDHSKKKDWQYYIDPKTGKIDLVDPEDPDAVKEFSKHNKGSIPVDVKLAGVGTSDSVKYWGADGEFSGKYGGASGSVAVSELEAHAEAYMGLLGIGASAGASYSVFNAEGKAYLGNEDTQIYVKGEATAGKVGAEIGASAGLIDKDGEFNPNLYAGASVEAIAGEVSGAVGGKVAGADVSVKGSVNFGVGAHANVGMHDGKISFDVGVALGPGVSVKVDVDLSGTIKAIGDTADKVTSFFKKLF